MQNFSQILLVLTVFTLAKLRQMGSLAQLSKNSASLLGHTVGILKFDDRATVGTLHLAWHFSEVGESEEVPSAGFLCKDR